MSKFFILLILIFPSTLFAQVETFDVIDETRLFIDSSKRTIFYTQPLYKLASDKEDIKLIKLYNYDQSTGDTYTNVLQLTLLESKTSKTKLNSFKSIIPNGFILKPLPVNEYNFDIVYTFVETDSIIGQSLKANNATSMSNESFIINFALSNMDAQLIQKTLDDSSSLLSVCVEASTYVTRKDSLEDTNYLDTINNSDCISLRTIGGNYTLIESNLAAANNFKYRLLEFRNYKLNDSCSKKIVCEFKDISGKKFRRSFVYNKNMEATQYLFVDRLVDITIPYRYRVYNVCKNSNITIPQWSYSDWDQMLDVSRW